MKLKPRIIAFKGSRFGMDCPIWDEFRKLGDLHLCENIPEDPVGLVAAAREDVLLLTDDIGIDETALKRMPNLRMINQRG